jgi:aldehyde dehydrogenase (NAD+)
MSDPARISEIRKLQLCYFRSGATREISFRLEMLDRLHDLIKENLTALHDALFADIGKSEFESYGSETGFLLDEIRYVKKRLKKWMKPKRAGIALPNLPASGHIIPEPYGVTLIFSAWNYPVQLLFGPLIGAIAGGNCVMLKPSKTAGNVARLALALIGKYFPEEYIAAFPGGHTCAEALLSEPFDLIFYTGNPTIGRKVMHAAAEHLTPVVLELGGKSPCIVDSDADLKVAAHRIIWGKFINAGQTCVAPDYMMVHSSIKDQLLEKMVKVIEEFYGEDPLQSPDLCKIINQHHFERLTALLDSGTILCGGNTDVGGCKIAPTLLTNVAPDSPVMQNEIFGPILPVIPFEDLGEVIDFVNERSKPLAMYYFGKDKTHSRRLLQATSAGGVCINETITHLTNPELPFGGVGVSGMGGYHGKYSFEAFSHNKPIMDKSTLIDVPLRYPPYKGKLKYLKMIIK